MSAPMRVRLGTILTVVAGLLLLAGPAWADGSGPTHYRSQVTGLTPDVDGVQVEVVGGDAFLEVRAEPGHTVTVLGYGRGGEDAEPYLRIAADGTVFANVNSPAYYLNNDRYAQVEVPTSASVDAEPDWQQLATGGVYRWHDHRIHWMSPGLPRAVERNPGDRVLIQEWTVPMQIDGTRVEAAGELYWLASTSPLLPIVVAVVAAAMLLAAWRATQSARAAPVGLLAAALAAGVVAVGLASAAGVGGAGLTFALLPPMVGLGLAGLALTRHGRDRAQTLLVGAAAVLAWALPRLGDTVKPVVPGVLPATVVSAGIAAATGAAAAAAGIAVLGLRRDRASDTGAGT